jgi:biotin transport system substrate-specific component
MEKVASITTNKIQSCLRTSLIVIAGSAFLALMAQVAIPLPFTPVPLTMQTLAVFLLGALLGSRNGALSVIAYLVEGSCGLPVFAGGTANALWFFGARAGYLVGFVIAAYIVGKIIERIRSKGILKLIAAIGAGQATILFCGWLWLSFFVGPIQAIVVGVLPFLITDIAKIASASLIIRGASLIKR